MKNAWKIHEVSRDKWYLLVARSPADKDKWMKALVNERKRVKEDQENSTLYFLRFYGHVHFSWNRFDKGSPHLIFIYEI